MGESTGVALPPRTKPAKVGNHWLGVIPVAQAARINDEVLVQLVSLEHRDGGGILNVRISRLDEMPLTSPPDEIPWPFLELSARDDLGSEYRADGGAGTGSQADWKVEFGLTGQSLAGARRLDITITGLRWEDLASGTVLSRTPGTWTFSVDLTTALPAQMV